MLRPNGQLGGRAGDQTPATPPLSRSFERSRGDFGAGGGRKLAQPRPEVRADTDKLAEDVLTTP